MPDPYTVQPLESALAYVNGEAVNAIHEIRRLEEVIATDDHLATIDQLARDLLRVAQESNAKDVTISTQNTTVIDLTQRNHGLESERDHLLERLTEIDDDLSSTAAELDRVTAERDAALADLAECEGDTEEPEPLIVGGSHPGGWVAMKALTSPVMPEAFRLFVPTARSGPQHVAVIRAVVGDGAIPFVSFTKPTVAQGNPSGPSPDTIANVAALVDAGLDEKAGRLTLVHEMTQKLSAEDFQAMVRANFPYYRANLPLWKFDIVFQRFDFVSTDPGRWPGDYLEGIEDLVDSIGVDVYDKGHSDAAGEGKSLAQLMEPCEEFARAWGKPLTIWEASAPDTGQMPGNPPRPPGRRAGWKPEWITEGMEHMLAATLDNGDPLYEAFVTYNGVQGEDVPEAAGEVPRGWQWDTTPMARAALMDAIESQR